MRPKLVKQLAEDNLDSKEDDKPTKPERQNTAASIDGLSSESEAESKSGDDEDNAETTLAIPKATKPATEPTKDRRISIAITSSGTSAPSKTFMTDLKTIDPSMVRKNNMFFVHSLLCNST